MDISKEVVNFAERGIYASETSQMVNASIFERLTETEKVEMFDWEGDQARVKSWLREGITWRVGNAGDPELMNTLGNQDIVVASNFLCHMRPAEAEKCLRNIAGLVSPGGYLFVSGVNLEVRTNVAVELGWEPVPELLAEIHDGDSSVRADWPWEWWGLEPLNQRKQNWQTHYAAVFRISGSAMAIT
jgi:SAM-dependent methyltransferase